MRAFRNDDGCGHTVPTTQKKGTHRFSLVTNDRPFAIGTFCMILLFRCLLKEVFSVFRISILRIHAQNETWAHSSCCRLPNTYGAQYNDSRATLYDSARTSTLCCLCAVVGLYRMQMQPICDTFPVWPGPLYTAQRYETDIIMYYMRVSLVSMLANSWVNRIFAHRIAHTERRQHKGLRCTKMTLGEQSG